MWVLLRDMESVATFDLWGDVHAQYGRENLLPYYKQADGNRRDPRESTPLAGVVAPRLACSLFIANVGVPAVAPIVQRRGRLAKTEVPGDFAVEGVVGVANQLGLIGLTLTSAPA